MNNKGQKAQLVSDIKQDLLSSDIVILLYYSGLSAKQLYDFRVSLKEKKIKLKIAKNTLTKIAIKGSDLDILSPYLKGQIAIACANDAVSLSKIVMASAKESGILKINAAYFNKAILSKDAINNLSKLGSLEEVRSEFIGKLNAVQANFVRVLNTPASSVVSLLNNYSSAKDSQ